MKIIRIFAPKIDVKIQVNLSNTNYRAKMANIVLGFRNRFLARKSKFVHIIEYIDKITSFSSTDSEPSILLPSDIFNVFRGWFKVP